MVLLLIVSYSTKNELFTQCHAVYADHEQNGTSTVANLSDKMVNFTMAGNLVIISYHCLKCKIAIRT